MDIEKYNADWLAAWTAKDTGKLLTFYAPQTPIRMPRCRPGSRVMTH